MYKLSTKRNGKWWSYGNVKKNQYGNLQLGIKITPEFLELVEESKTNGWLNMSLFEEKENKHTVDKGNAFVNDVDDSEIPF